MIRKFSTFVLAILTIAAIAAIPSGSIVAQTSDYGALQRLLDGESAAVAITAISTHAPVIVRYVGSAAAGGTVTVAAGTGDITLSLGAVGASAVDTTLECPVSGALGGIIDVSDAACDTLGEVVNVLNKSPNWRAVLRDGMAADSSNDTLATLAETAANSVGGLGLLGDTAVTFDIAGELTPERTIARSLDTSRQNAIVPNPAQNSRVALFQAIGTSTYASGTSTFEVFSCKTLYPTQYASGAAVSDMTETCTTLDSQAGGATTAAKTFNYSFALESKKNERLIVRLNNSAAMTAGTLYAYGRVATLK